MSYNQVSGLENLDEKSAIAASFSNQTHSYINDEKVNHEQFFHTYPEDSFSFVGEKPHKWKRPMKTFLIEFAIWAAITAYSIALWIAGSKKDGAIFYTMVYIIFTLRMVARHFSITYYVYEPVGKIWNNSIGALSSKVSGTILWFGIAGVTLATMLVCALTTNSNTSTVANRLQSFVGVILLLALCFFSSKCKRGVDLQVVSVGLTIQFLIALLVLRTDSGQQMFRWLASFVTKFLNFSKIGASFLFGNLPENFAVHVFPAIVFFCAFIQIVYYFGGMQYIVEKMAAVVCRVLNVSGAEAVVASASPFIGQGESALLVKPFVEFMTMSELHAVMTSGFATISGSVLLGFTSIVDDTSFLLTSCIMSIPCSLLVSKLRYPETEDSLTKGEVKVPESDEEKPANFLHAAGNGAATGAELVILIAASILALVSLFEAANSLVGWLFHMINIYKAGAPILEDSTSHWITVQYLLSFVFFPFAWMIGIPPSDCRLAAEYMAQKMLVNEFTAYKDLFAHKGLEDRTYTLMTFALCGFANIGSIGIQVGCLGALAPKRKSDIASIAFSAMLAGTVSTWLSAAIAGTLL